MHAVIRTGGKQYRVQEGDVLRVERLAANEGDIVEFKEVLALGDGADLRVGTPYVEGSTVSATIQSHGRAKKITVIKFRRRKNYLRRQGHRQHFTEVRITGIASG